MEEFAKDNSKFDENGRKFSKQVENTMGKGEIAPNEHFSFFQVVFKSLELQTRKNQGFFGKGLMSFANALNESKDCFPHFFSEDSFSKFESRVISNSLQKTTYFF